MGLISFLFNIFFLNYRIKKLFKKTKGWNSKKIKEQKKSTKWLKKLPLQPELLGCDNHVKIWFKQINPKKNTSQRKIKKNA